jgi:hypothetical protein
MEVVLISGYGFSPSFFSPEVHFCSNNHDGKLNIGSSTGIIDPGKRN